MKTLSLTFDDGPNGECTEAILALLAAYGVPATFFPIGERSLRHPELIRVIELMGHQVENHTHTHRILTGDLSYKELDQEIGGWGTYFRPPGGHYDDAVLRYLELHSIQLALWHLDSFDWALRTVDEIVDCIDSQVTDDGGIILLHDGDSRLQVPANCWRTVEAVKRIIPKYQAQGFRFAPLSEMELPGKPRRTAL